MSGILLMLAGFFGTFWGIYQSFAALDNSESAGIGAVGGWIRFALVSSIVGILAIIPVAVGLVKLYKASKSKN
jgi:biopolymer transport protein ExbB/TolQ